MHAAGDPDRPTAQRPAACAAKKGPPGFRSTRPTTRRAPKSSHARGTRSWRPMETPPVVRTTSYGPASAARNRARRASGRSGTSPPYSTSHPARASSAASAKALVFTVHPGGAVAGGSISSSPVQNSTTRGLRWTRTSRTPPATSAATAPGVTASPGRSSTAPSASCSCASATWRLTGTGLVTTTAAPSRLTHSTGSTRSPLSGMAAPVLVTHASPRAGPAPGGFPGRASPVTRSRTGACADAVRTSSSWHT
ncbi:hypothetical protein HRbin32_01841 [bacterium HR32]|nr:hypothetical protein HRbin32_01841 [bacterium HR32]